MTIQSKRGPNVSFPGTHIHLSPTDLTTLERHIQANQGSGATFVGYHKRRRRSLWLDRNGQYRFYKAVA